MAMCLSSCSGCRRGSEDSPEESLIEEASGENLSFGYPEPPVVALEYGAFRKFSRVRRLVFGWFTDPWRVRFSGIHKPSGVDAARASAIAGFHLLLIIFYVQQTIWGPEAFVNSSASRAMTTVYLGVLALCYVATRLGWYERAAVVSTLLCWLPILRGLTTEPFVTLSAVCQQPREPESDWLCAESVDSITFTRNMSFVVLHLLLLLTATTLLRFVVVAAATIVMVCVGTVVTVRAMHPDVTLDFTHLNEAIIYVVVVAVLLFVLAAIFQNDMYKIQAQQAQLQRSKVRLAQFAKWTSEAIVICSEQLQIKDCNPAFSAMFGYDSKRDVPDLASLFASGSVPRAGACTDCKRKDGTFFKCETSWFREGDARALMIRDVSAALESEKAKLAELHARTASDAKTAALVNLSHELRTPLNTVLGNLQLLLDDTSPQNVKDCSRAAWKASSTLLQLLNDILDISKLEAGRFELDSSPLDVADLVEDTVEMMYRQAAKKGIELFCFVPPMPPCCKGDQLRIKQVLCNLIGNSIKFTERGHVSLEASVVPVEGGNVRATFVIEDTGIGITEDQLAKLFTRFVQASSGISKQFGGTGLGLAISKQLVELMKGSIEVTSTIGQGSVFTVTIVLPSALGGAAKAASYEFTELPSDLPQTSCVVAVGSARQADIVGRHMEMLGVKAAIAPGLPEAMTLLANAADDGRSGHPPPKPLLFIDEAVRTAVRPEIFRLASVICLSTEPLVSQEFASIRKPLTHRKLRVALASHTAKNLLQQASHNQKPRSLKVLVCEDNKVNSKMVSRMLTNLGHTVATAFNGAEAVEECKQQPFSVVFMDTNMPIMGGEQATRTIRSEPGPNRDVPIIAFSANVFDEDIRRCLESGASDYLAKPVMKAELISILARWGGAQHMSSLSADAGPTAGLSTFVEWHAPTVDEASSPATRSMNGAGNALSTEPAAALLAAPSFPKTSAYDSTADEFAEVGSSRLATDDDVRELARASAALELAEPSC